MTTVKNIKIQDLIPAQNNPFNVKMDADMEKLIESIAENGVILPIIATPTENGKYEIVSGHRRKFACEYLEMEKIPTIVKELDLNERAILMVDSNLQRENILPSEKAKAYKLKMDALAKQGKRNDLTGGQVGHKTRDTISDTDSGRQIQRYIRLNNLIPQLLELVDEKRIALTTAVELSYLPEELQKHLYEEININDCTPSLSQACRFRKIHTENILKPEDISEIMTEQKANQVDMFRMPLENIKRYSPKSNEKQLQEFVLKACEHYSRYLRRMRDRDTR